MDAATAAATSGIMAGNPGAILGGVVVIILLMIPLINQFLNSRREQNTQISLYTQLSEQLRAQAEEIRIQKTEVEKVLIQRNELQERIIDLKSRVEHLESVEDNNEELRITISTLKSKLDEKDYLIRVRDERLNEYREEISVMKERIHQLELRVKEDEIKFSESQLVPRKEA